MRERAPDPIRVLVADGDTRFRSLIGAVLAGLEDILVIGEAADGYEALALAMEWAPDLVLLDVRMPGGGGIGAAQSIHRYRPLTKVVLLAGTDNDEDTYQALKAGASGYLLREGLIDALPGIIRTLAHGAGVFLSPFVAVKLVDELALDRLWHTKPGLSKRELEVLELVAQGDTNDQIADRMCLSSHTVKRHVANILAKLHERTRADAVMHATQAGVLLRR